jgi:Concanavalin A-like lectin/glucanases superfamily
MNWYGPRNLALVFTLATLIVGLVTLRPLVTTASDQLQVPEMSMRFNGTGSGDIDRVKFPLDAPASGIDVAGDFTIELWLKATPNENATGTCMASTSAGDMWIYGNILLDRDIYGEGDFGDYGAALFGAGQIGFGVDTMSGGATICGGTNLDDGLWHHVALTRSANPATQASERLQIFVDGVRVAAGNGPLGDISYRDGRPTSWPNSDPFLVLGAEKHDAGPEYPSFRGWIDDLRISNVVRYTASGYTRPTAPIARDAQTVALYRFNEGAGTTITDDGGLANGLLKAGVAPAGPFWSTDIPFSVVTPPTTTPDAPTATAIPPTATAIPSTATAIPSTATAIPSTATAIPPTATPTLVNLLLNPGFEIDTNNDTRPDSWTSSARFLRSTTLVRTGVYSGRHQAANNANFTIAQTITGLSANRSYELAGWVNIPATSDAFSISIQIRWRNSSGGTLRTDIIQTYSATTGGWVNFTASRTSPANTASALVQMVATNLNALIYVDDLSLQSLIVAPTPTLVPATATLVPATATLVPATPTLVPATATLVPATATLVPATATLVPATATPVGGVQNQALTFDGTTDELRGSSLPHNPAAQTIELWVRPATDNQNSVLFTTSDDQSGWSLEINGGRATMWVYNAGGIWRSAQNSAVALRANTWYHVAVTFSNGTARVYVDGQQGPASTIGALVQGPFVRVGGLPGYPYFSGMIDEIRLSNVVRYTAAFTRPAVAFTADAQTVALYHLDDLAQSAADFSGNAYTLTLGASSAADTRDPAWGLSTAPTAR